MTSNERSEAQIFDTQHDLDALTPDEIVALQLQVEAWAAQATAPMHAESAEIDRQIAALSARKKRLHAEIDAIEARSAKRRYELRGPHAGPDQLLVPAGMLGDEEIARMRQLVDQYDRTHE